MSDARNPWEKSVDAKLDKLMEINESQTTKLHDHDLKLQKYNLLLDEHIRRTNLVEENLKEHQIASERKHKEIKAEIHPLVEHQIAAEKLKKIVVSIGAILGVIYTAMKIANML